MVKIFLVMIDRFGSVFHWNWHAKSVHRGSLSL